MMRTSLLHHIQAKERRRTSMGVQFIFLMVEASPTEVGAHLGFQDQSALNWSPRTHPDSVFNDPHMVRKLI
jgi:hypothetical protein